MNVFDIFKNVKSAAIAIGIIAVVGVIGVQWVQKVKAAKTIADLNLKVTNLEQDVFREQIRASGYKIVIETLEETYAKIEKHRAAEAEIENEIESSPPEDDAAIAPVLRRTLDGVGRMLGNN